MILFIFLKMVQSKIQSICQHQTVMTVNFIQCCLFYERIFAGGYVLKKKT